MDNKRRVPPTRIIRAAPQKKTGWYKKLQSGVKRIEADPFVKIFAGISAIVGLCVLLQTSFQIRVDLADRESERIDNALTKLATRGARESGRGAAITLLNEKGWDDDKSWNIATLDQSCETVGDWGPRRGQAGDRVDLTPVCNEKPRIANLRLQPSKPVWSDFITGYSNPISDWLKNVLFQDIGSLEINTENSEHMFGNVRFDQAEIINPIIEYQFFFNLNLYEAEISGGSFDKSQITGYFVNTKFSDINLYRTVFFGNFSGARFENVNLSDTRFQTTRGIDKYTFDGVAWADSPPLMLAKISDVEKSRGMPPPYKLGSIYTPFPAEFLQNVRFCEPPNSNLARKDIDRWQVPQSDCIGVPAEKVIEDYEAVMTKEMADYKVKDGS